MIDPTTGRRPSCPMCGSDDVRWRGRRIYDYPLNFARYVIEAVLGAIGVGRPNIYTGDARTINASSVYSPGGIASERDAKHVAMRIRYRHVRDVNDDIAAAAMPRWFWKCRACHRHGHVFDSPDRLEPMRGAITRIEAQIRDDGGVVINPVRGDHPDQLPRHD